MAGSEQTDAVPYRDLVFSFDIYPRASVGRVSLRGRGPADPADVLREIPAAVRFISAEPLLGSLAQVPGEEAEHVVRSSEPRAGSQARLNGPGGSPTLLPRRVPLDLTGIDWLIVGGESQKGARPMNVSWAVELLDACRAAETAFFMKQLGAVLGRQLGGGNHGDDERCFPANLRIREFPVYAALAS